MSTPAQIAANKINAQRSPGPRHPEGKLAIAQNNFRHGFTGAFRILPGEKQAEFDALLLSFRTHHQPATELEGALIEKMAQHFWLAQRALSLQDTCFNRSAVRSSNNSNESAAPILNRNAEKQLALYLRYHSTHDRAFYKCANELRSLRNEKRKAEIGFESQERKRNEQRRREASELRKQAAEARRELNENRRQQLHDWALLLAEAKFLHQEVLTRRAESPQRPRPIAETKAVGSLKNSLIPR